MKQVIRPPIAPCLTCGRGYDATELPKLDRLKSLHEGIGRYRCADCGNPVAVPDDIVRDAQDWTIDVDSYAEKFPNLPDRPVLWETSGGNIIPPWLAWFATTTDRRVFVVGVVVLALVLFPELRAEIVAWVKEAW